jgi:GTP-binding protein Era
METKSAFVAVVGNSNVGKSTLVNNLVGMKVSIVTHKVQTTRSRIRAIYTKSPTQLVFVDTPGIFRPKKKLERYIVKNAWSAFSGVDIFVLVIDPRQQITEDIQTIIKKLGDHAILVINKIDLIDKIKLLKIAEEFNKLRNFQRTFMISALKNSGMDDLKDYLLDSALPGPWYFDEEDETDMPLKFNLAEILREKLFLRVHQELPYSLTVETENVEENPDKIVIHQTIYVGSESHKKIIIGKQGENIKNIRVQATKDMESLLDKRVNLFLFVKVRKNWEDRSDILGTLTY